MFVKNIVILVFFSTGILGCYDDHGRPIKCITPFENIAYERSVEASNTCGISGPSEYYPNMFSNSIATCDSNTPRLSHGTEYITDSGWRTWWQSDSLMDGVLSVNLTLNFGK